MTFLGRVGSILKQSVSKQISSQISASNPSVYQALRCMSSSKLFVAGLGHYVDDHHLWDAFSQYGEVIDVKLIVDHEENKSRGFGFVTFASTEEAISAIQALHGQNFQGRRVTVDYAVPRFSSGRGYGEGQGYGSCGGYGGDQGYGSGGGGYGGGSYGGGYGGGNTGGYGGGNSGGYVGDAPAQQYGGNSGGYSCGGSHGVAAGVGDSYFGGGAAGGNVTAETGFASSGFEDASGALGNNSGDFGSLRALEETFKDDDDDSDNFAKRA